MVVLTSSVVFRPNSFCCKTVSSTYGKGTGVETAPEFEKMAICGGILNLAIYRPPPYPARDTTKPEHTAHKLTQQPYLTV